MPCIDMDIWSIAHARHGEKLPPMLLADAHHMGNICMDVTSGEFGCPLYVSDFIGALCMLQTWRKISTYVTA